MFKGRQADSSAEQDITLPTMQLSEHVVHDYDAMALSLKAHPVSFVRENLSQLRITTTQSLGNLKNGVFVFWEWAH